MNLEMKKGGNEMIWDGNMEGNRSFRVCNGLKNSGRWGEFFFF